MYDGAIGARQPIKTYRWLIPAVHLHTLDVIQQLGAVPYGERIAEAECFCRRAAAVLNCCAVFLIPGRAYTQ